jgi:hypothetical protein
MKKHAKDRHLDIPSEANRDKHINFLALEHHEMDPADIPAEGPLTDQSMDDEKKQRFFDLLINNIPYHIKVMTFSFNENVRYYVSVNNSPDHIFAWDDVAELYRDLDEDSSTLPAVLEEAIREKLQTMPE